MILISVYNYVGNGRKCVLENGRPTCGCALTCPNHYKPICGSDGVTYQNPCELHRASCLQNIKIHKHLRGPCPGKDTFTLSERHYMHKGLRPCEQCPGMCTISLSAGQQNRQTSLWSKASPRVCLWNVYRK